MPKGTTAITPSCTFFPLFDFDIQFLNVLLHYFLNSGHKIISQLNPINSLGVVYWGQVTYPVQHPCGKGSVKDGTNNNVYIIYLKEFLL